VLGAGLGGFFDGIVFHQILQWHHMLTATADHPASTLRGLEVNTLWDGLFHAVTYLLVIVGAFMMWTRLRDGGPVPSRRGLVGWGLVGWGSFNLVEGLVSHHILEIHHVRSGPNEVTWDVLFLTAGFVLCLIGWRVIRSNRRQSGRYRHGRIAA
jgi:uncharacterized membrane protein